jgi:O-methyltransferase
MNQERPLFQPPEWGVVRRQLDKIAGHALSTRATVQATYDLTVACIRNRVPGDFVECGVFAGAQVGAMLLACVHYGAFSRRIHMFDSFAGLPPPGPKDSEFCVAGYAGGEAKSTLDDTMDSIRRMGEGIEWPTIMLVPHVGYFQETIPQALAESFISQIALLRLDGDLYESTAVALELYPLVHPDGWVIVDDYHLSGCRQAITDTIGHPGPIYFRRIP